MIKNICLKFKCLIVLISVLICVSCKKQKLQTLILWTDNVEFASYVELFNASQSEVKVAAVYKSSLLDSLDPKSSQIKPDVIAGSYLAYGIKSNYFSSLNKIFTDDFNREQFYPELLQIGARGKKQFLLPVSFNLTALVFDLENSSFVKSSNTISVEQIKESSKLFNQKDKDLVYKKMAFAPQWNPDFLYLTLVAKSISFTSDGQTLKYNAPILENAIASLRNWTSEINTSDNDEKDFAFKYLYTPFNKQVLQQKSLFAAISSEKLLALSEDELDKIDFRWFVEDEKAPVRENLSMIGIYKHSKNKKTALKFIQWFMNKDSQEQMIIRRINMNLDTNTFGIANGFSSLIRVNEQVLPGYYKVLLARTPFHSIPKAPSIYPAEWEAVKKEIIIPYLVSSLGKNSSPADLSYQFAEWAQARKEE